MFGLSIAKILVIVGVVIALWRGIKIITALRDRIALDERLRARRDAAPPPAKATDLVECPKCGTFVPNGTICPSKEQCLLKKSA